MIKVFDHPLSPYGQKVKIALLEKGLEFKAELPSNLGAGGAAGDFVGASPRGEVPALLHDGVSVFDSTIILEYIEDCWPRPALLPASAADRARVRMLEDVMDTHVEAINWGMAEIVHFGRLTGAAADQVMAGARTQLSGWYAWLEKQLAGRDWFNGDAFGWGDLCVVPFVNGAAGFDVWPAPDSRLADWLGRANARDSVKRVSQDAAQMAMAGNQAGMAAVRDLLEQGLFKREYRDHRLEWMVKSAGLAVVEAGLRQDNIRFTAVFD